MYVRYTVLVQKGNKHIIKAVHVTSVGYLECFEASKIHFGPKITVILLLLLLSVLSPAVVCVINVKKQQH